MHVSVAVEKRGKEKMGGGTWRGGNNYVVKV